MPESLRYTRRVALLTIAVASLTAPTAWAAWPMVTVHKDPTCGCCGGWVAHLEVNGFRTKTIETKTLNRVKARLGIPPELHACHTAEVGPYLIEGHVPAIAIVKLLTERPKAKGLAVPGMPEGSPGMSGEYEEYDVILFGANEQRVFGKFKGEKEI